MSDEMPSIYPGGPKLRFDDGPGPYTAALLDVLARHGVKATFCVLGVHAQAQPELVMRARAEEHTIASHAMDHAGLDELSESDLRGKLAPASDLLAELTGRRPTLLGPPMDRKNNLVRQVAYELGMQLISYDVDPQDFTQPGVQVLVDAILAAQPGAIVLLHDAAPPGTPENAQDRGQTITAIDRALCQLLV